MYLSCQNLYVAPVTTTPMRPLYSRGTILITQVHNLSIYRYVVKERNVPAYNRMEARTSIKKILIYCQQLIRPDVESRASPTWGNEPVNGPDVTNMAGGQLHEYWWCRSTPTILPTFMVQWTRRCFPAFPNMLQQSSVYLRVYADGLPSRVAEE